MTKNIIFFLLIFIVCQLLTLQYSVAQTITRVSKAPTDSIEPEGQLTIKDENKTINKEFNETKFNKTSSNETEKQAPKEILPEKNITGGTMTSNGTELIKSPPYKIRVIFERIEMREDHDPITSGCGEVDLAAYVQGKLVQLSDASGTPEHPTTLWHVCAAPVAGKTQNVYFKPGTEMTVDIPVELVETRGDSQPLSIFTVGVEVDNCGKVTWPSELQNVEKILTEKGTTRPYYAGVKEKIADIQSHMSEAGKVGDNVCSDINKNDVLQGINILESSPGYGKTLAPDTHGNPASSAPIQACTYIDFCLWYTIDCPLCAGIRGGYPDVRVVPPP